MGDGTGAVMLDGKMEDDASVKQCQVMVELADQLADRDPELADAYGFSRRPTHERPTLRPRRSVLYMPGANERALEKAKTIPADALILDLEDAVAPDAKVEARDRVCAAAASGELRQARRSPSGPTALDTAVARRRPRGHRRGRARRRRGAQDQLGRRRARPSRRPSRRPAPPTAPRIWAMLETPIAMLHAEEIAAASERLTVLVMGTNDLAKELHAEHVPGRQPLLYGLSACACWPPATPAR